MKTPKKFQHVTVIEQIYHTTREDYGEKTYDIEIDDERLCVIYENSMKYLYEQMGKILFPEKGGENE